MNFEFVNIYHKQNWREASRLFSSVEDQVSFHQLVMLWCQAVLLINRLVHDQTITKHYTGVLDKLNKYIKVKELIQKQSTLSPWLCISQKCKWDHWVVEISALFSWFEFVRFSLFSKWKRLRLESSSRHTKKIHWVYWCLKGFFWKISSLCSFAFISRTFPSILVQIFLMLNKMYFLVICSVHHLQMMRRRISLFKIELEN